MAERSGMWGGTPNRPEHPANLGRRGTERPAANRWGPERLVEPDRADAIDGRHALDRDAALTPIFTALRRGRWRRPRGQAGAPGLRLAPEPVERRQDGPPTSPIPVVPALHALDPYPTGGYSAATVDPNAVGWFPRGRPATRRAVSARSSRMRRADSAGRSSRRPHPVVTGRCPSICTRAVTRRRSSCTGGLGRAASDAGPRLRPSIPSTRARSSRARAPPPSRTETTAVWSPGDYSMPPQQVTDTGRHHRRLAPAGW